MPAKSADGFSWDTLMDGPVRWMTKGIDADPNDHSLRRGFARVRVNGNIVKVLLRGWTEQAWTVRLVGDVNANLGPSRVLLTPSDDYQCEYASSEGCEFTATDALRGSNLRAQSVCTGHFDPGQPLEVFHIEAPGKHPIYAEIVDIGRSNYGGTWVQLTMDNPGCAVDPNSQEDVDQPAASSQNVATSAGDNSVSPGTDTNTEGDLLNTE